MLPMGLAHVLVQTSLAALYFAQPGSACSLGERAARLVQGSPGRGVCCYCACNRRYRPTSQCGEFQGLGAAAAGQGHRELLAHSNIAVDLPVSSTRWLPGKDWTASPKTGSFCSSIVPGCWQSIIQMVYLSCRRCLRLSNLNCSPRHLRLSHCSSHQYSRHSRRRLSSTTL